jgi:ATP-dependent HslUV protease ATP-binding subunit HslU
MYLTPKQIVSELDKYIIGQDNAKKAVAIALRNRYRRQNTPKDVRDDIMPNNIILIGPTGTGKTEISRRLAQLARAPFLKIEATKFTEVGYVGRDVESIIRDLADIAVAMVKEERTIEVEEKAREAAEDRILDILLPLSNETPGSSNNPVNIPGEVEEKRQRTREKFRQQLQSGALDDRLIEVELPKDPGSMMQVFGPMGMEDISSNIQDMFSNMMPKKHNRQKVKVSKAKELLKAVEAEKLIDMESVKNTALERLQNHGIVFIDEIDKIAVQSSGKGPDVSRQGVQRDLLPIVEGTRVVTKHGPVKTDHILFIAAGAFNVAKPSDLIPELQGRFPIRVELNSLTKNDFIRILTEPKTALTKQYSELLQTEDVKLEFAESALEAIAEKAFAVNEKAENIGARRLQTVMSTLLEDFLFEVPDTHYETIKIDDQLVEEKLGPLVKDEDLSRFIL